MLGMTGPKSSCTWNCRHSGLLWWDFVPPYNCNDLDNSTVARRKSAMSVQEWGIVIGVLVSGVLALGPWMFMVHAKLAVLANQVATLCRKIERTSELHDKLWTTLARHEAKLETHDVQIAQIGQRLKDLA